MATKQIDKFYSRLEAKKAELEAKEAKTTEEQGEILVPVVAKTVKEAVAEVMQKDVLVCNLCGTEFKTEKGLEKHAGSDICFKRQEKRMKSTNPADISWSIDRQIALAKEQAAALYSADLARIAKEAEEKAENDRLDREAFAFKAKIDAEAEKHEAQKAQFEGLDRTWTPAELLASLEASIKAEAGRLAAEKMSEQYARAEAYTKRQAKIASIAHNRKLAEEFTHAERQKPVEYQARVNKAREWYMDFINGKIVLPVSEKAQHRMRKQGKQVFKFKALVWNVMDRFYFAISTYALGALAENIEPSIGETWFTLSNYNKLSPRIFDAAVMPYLVTEPDRTINYIRREVDDDGNIRDYTEAKFVKGFTVEEAQEIFEAWVEAVWIAKNITYHKKPVVLAFKRWMAHGEDLDPELASVVDKKRFVDQDEILGDIKLEIGPEVDPEYHEALEMQEDLTNGVEPITR